MIGGTCTSVTDYTEALASNVDTSACYYYKLVAAYLYNQALQTKPPKTLVTNVGSGSLLFYETQSRLDLFKTPCCFTTKVFVDLGGPKAGHAHIMQR